ncbi:hypothetical protein NDN08_000534 [Rhodosorus marinus]|uniref:Rubredoxin-like domain-containing protein n=1 Tax=Rhodosorus marinus TaxID=101924 RepID=A0AAV8UNF3_9RHOD|nr:hypothetical protein NDN08_000534 [Rhodosorus marinus]
MAIAFVQGGGASRVVRPKSTLRVRRREAFVCASASESGLRRIEVGLGTTRTQETNLVELVAVNGASAAIEEDINVFERYAGSVGYVWLYFGAFCSAALGLKWLRKKQMEMNNEKPKNPTIITSEEMEAELHIFKCGGCGYEMYPARTREFKFFPDDFKCPVCGSGKEEFWDLNDPNDPRNQEEEEEEESEQESEEEASTDEQVDVADDSMTDPKASTEESEDSSESSREQVGEVDDSATDPKTSADVIVESDESSEESSDDSKGESPEDANSKQT